MALKEPDMGLYVKKKQRCLNGPNIGIAYDPADPCEAGLEFNALSCECNPLTYEFAVKMVGNPTSTTNNTIDTIINPGDAPALYSPAYADSFTHSCPRLLQGGCTWGTALTVTNTIDCTGGGNDVHYVAAYNFETGAADGALYGIVTSSDTNCTRLCGNNEPGCDGRTFTSSFSYFIESVPGSGVFDTPFSP